MEKSGRFAALRNKRAAVLALVVVGGLLFGAGYLVGNDADQVDRLSDDLASREDELSAAEASVSESEIAASDAQEALEDAEEELEAERSLRGGGQPQPVTERTYDTDFDWGAAGTVGYLTIRPIAFEKSGSKWILTVEAKNESSEPRLPFCGDAGSALGDTTGNAYTGDNLIDGSSDSCEDLQPGLTGTYKAEFELPEEADPAVAVIYGDYEQEDDGKSWSLP